LGPATTRPGGSFEISAPQKEHSSLRTKSSSPAPLDIRSKRTTKPIARVNAPTSLPHTKPDRSPSVSGMLRHDRVLPKRLPRSEF
jgi:hypothetical protein